MNNTFWKFLFIFSFLPVLLFGDINKVANTEENTIYNSRAIFLANCTTCIVEEEGFGNFTGNQRIETLFSGLVTLEGSEFPTVFSGGWQHPCQTSDFSGNALIPEPRFQGTALVLNFSMPVYGVGAAVYDDHDGTPIVNVITLSLVTTVGDTLKVSETCTTFGEAGFLGGTSDNGIVKAIWSIDNNDGNLEIDELVVIREEANNFLTVNCDPTNINFECTGYDTNKLNARVWNANNISTLEACATSSCNNITITSDYDFNNLSDDCGLTGSLTVTYTITDDCGNSVNKIALITILDTSPPISACDPIDETHECNGLEGNSFASLAWNQYNLTALENCTSDNCGGITVTSDYDFNNLSDDCGLTGSLTVTYTITDDCGNSTTKTATFTIVDTEQPIVNYTIPNIVINCGEVPSVKAFLIQQNQQHISDLTNASFDNCGNITVTSDFNATIISDNCQAQPTTTVTFTVTDECGNFATVDWNYTIIDRNVGNELCDNLNIQSIDNQLIITGLSNLNTITKVFDPNWQLVYQCNANCNETETIPNLTTGETYHTDIQFYDESWNFICEDRQDVVIIGGEMPCGIGNDFYRVKWTDKMNVVENGFDIGNAVSGWNNSGATSENILPAGTDGWIEYTVADPNGDYMFGLTYVDKYPADATPNYFRISYAAYDRNLGNIHSYETGRERTLSFTSSKVGDIIRLERIGTELQYKVNGTIISTSPVESKAMLIEVVFNYPDKMIKDVKASFGVSCQISTPTCENIQILTDNNQILITGLTAPNEIVKVFDRDFNIVYQCVANCEETQMAGTFPEGNYTIDLQLYDENWGVICSEQRVIALINEPEPCDTTVCQGKVFLADQAAVDAFCGCEVIEGDLIVGTGTVSNAMPTPPTDIVNIESLRDIKVVKGSLVFNYTQLEDVRQLSNLQEVQKSIVFIRNNDLTSLKGLEQITSALGLVLESNIKLSVFDGLDGLRELGFASLERLAITSLEFFAPIVKDTAFNGISIVNCDSLTSLAGLENLRRTNGITLAVNDKLTDISALRNLEFLSANLTIDQNPLLDDCCAIRHLIDEDMDNGRIAGDASIKGNLANCISTDAILQSCPKITSDCENIDITTTLNQITLSNITAPNSIVKVFDDTYQIVFDCTADCESEVVVSIANAGTYHTDVQFYDENWNFICQDRQDIEVKTNNYNCNPSTCVGNFAFDDQMAIDTFCGCEIITGTLRIGPPFSLGDITNIENLSKIRKAKGFILQNTNLVNLEPLNQLSIENDERGFIVIRDNPKLLNLDGLTNLQNYYGDISINHNQAIENFDALQLSERVGNIAIFDNEKLVSIKGLANMRIAENVYFRNNGSLTSLEGLIKLDSILGNKQFFLNEFGLSIYVNDNLKDISALRNLQFIGNKLALRANVNLQDCCTIRHLIDNDPTNGIVLGSLSFNDNGVFCNSPEEILQNCQNPPTSPCENVEFQAANTQLSITNLTAPIAIVKVFDNNYATVYDCFADCEEAITLNDLAAGRYHVTINLYDENWQPICEKIESVEVGGNAQDRSRQFLPSDFALFPNPAESVTYLDLSKLKGEAVQLKLYNQFGQMVSEQTIETVTETKAKIDISTFQNGLYILKMETKGRRAIAKKLLVSRLY